MPYKEILSVVAIVLTFLAFVPYIFSILKGTIKPHVFSWIVWSTTTFVVFLAQLKGNAGVGAWPIGVSGVITIFIAVLACSKRGDITITRTDCFFLLSALSSLPLWYLTSDPLWAVVILTIVDLLGFGPTIRKVYRQPQSEPAMFYSLFAVRDCFVILALEQHSLTTVLFPAVVGMTCVFIVALLIYRRQIIAATDFRK